MFGSVLNVPWYYLIIKLDIIVWERRSQDTHNHLAESPKRADVFLTEKQKFVVRNLELCCLIMSLTEAALKKISKDEVTALTLANIADLKSGFRRFGSELSISWSVNSTLSKKCLYSELFWSVFSRIRTEFGEIWSISPHSVRIQEQSVHQTRMLRYHWTSWW